MCAQNNGWLAEEEPIYNIGVVSRMTGVPVATLRVWERRYEFPNSARTEGGHRLYSEKEIARLRWVKATIDSGMQTGQAVRALHLHEREGHSVLSLQPLPVVEEAPGDDRSPLVSFQKRLADALMDNNVNRAEQILGEILALYPLEDLILQVIRPTLVQIGEGWEEGSINVATEHLATQFLRHRLMLWLSMGPQSLPVRPTVLACAPDEWHEVSLLMLGVLLRRRRWPVAYLGQAVPLPDLARFVEDIRPPAVVLVAMTEETATSLLDIEDHLSVAIRTGRPAVAYAGLAYTAHPELQSRMPGTFLGTTLSEGVDTLERLLRSATALSY